jgi:Leucine-rich repeat (LRR) protein
MASPYAGENGSTANGRVREITVETLVQASKLTVGKNEHLDQYLKRVTHLTLNGNEKKVFKKIQLLEKCPNLKVLYMYDNEIETIENINCIPLLTHLHLQHNWIQKMEGMEALPLLEKLYIEGNRIPRLEGLGNCVYLQELHMSNQNLAKSETFSFDEATIQALSVR